MGYELNEQQVLARKQTIEVMENKFMDHRNMIEKDGILNEQHIQYLQDFGLWDQLINDNTDWVTKITILIEMARVSPSLVGVLTDVIKCESILSKKSDQTFYSTAFVEEHAGSDLYMIETSATKDGGAWLITGEKWFVSNTAFSDTFLVLAKRQDGSFAVFEVPKRQDGIKVTEQKKMGLMGLKLSKINFSNVSVTSSSIILDMNDKLDDLHSMNDLSQLAYAALAIGISESALDISLERTKARYQFGKPIGEFQAIQFKIAKMTIGINSGKSLLYNAAQKVDRNEGNTEIDIAVAKVYTTESANKAVDLAMQIHGSHGVLDDSIVSSLYRSQRLTEVFGQTSELQRIKIADYIVNKNTAKNEEVNHGFQIQ